VPSLCLRAFAKINLGLRILARRPDGYHEIRTVYQAISLADRLRVSLGGRRGGIEVRADDPCIPQGPGNLVYRACEAWRRARRNGRAIRVDIEKRIPAASGLGGASSDAAAAFLALERLAGDRLAPAARYELTAGLGSDVPFFLEGGRALGCGRGEEVYALPSLPSRRCLVVWPGFAQSTAEAYAAAGSQLTTGREGLSMYSFGKWPQFPWVDWGPAENDFEGVAFARWPELARLKRRLIRAGAEVASLTGSGSAVYALFASSRQMARASQLIPKAWQVFPTKTLVRAEYHRRIFVH